MVFSKQMPPTVSIGGLIESREGIRGGRPCVAGTGRSVRSIAIWHNMGLIPEEIARRAAPLTLAQVYAALTHYYANRPEMDAEIEAEEALALAHEQQHK